MSLLIGGGKCSLCGSFGTNKLSCPLRPESKNGGDPIAHPKAMVQLSPEVIKEREQEQSRIRFTKVKKLTQLTDQQRKQRAQRIERNKSILEKDYTIPKMKKKQA